MTDRDQRAVSMAHMLLEGTPLVQVASAHRVSPSYASRELKHHLPKVNVELGRQAADHLKDLRRRSQTVNAQARWIQQRSSLYEQLRGVCRRLERARVEGNEEAVADEAARAHALIDRIAGAET